MNCVPMILKCYDSIDDPPNFVYQSSGPDAIQHWIWRCHGLVGLRKASVDWSLSHSKVALIKFHLSQEKMFLTFGERNLVAQGAGFIDSEESKWQIT
jgi:hypothetical protein